MARLQVLELPAARLDTDPHYLLVIDLIDGEDLAHWQANIAQLKADTGAVGVVVTTDRLDVLQP